MPTIKSLPARHRISTFSLLSNRNFFPFLLACGAIQSSHGLYYGFATIYWKSIGLSETIIGSLNQITLLDLIRPKNIEQHLSINIPIQSSIKRLN